MQNQAFDQGRTGISVKITVKEKKKKKRESINQKPLELEMD